MRKLIVAVILIAALASMASCGTSPVPPPPDYTLTIRPIRISPQWTDQQIAVQCDYARTALADAGIALVVEPTEDWDAPELATVDREAATAMIHTEYQDGACRVFLVGRIAMPDGDIAGTAGLGSGNIVLATRALTHGIGLTLGHELGHQLGLRHPVNHEDCFSGNNWHNIMSYCYGARFIESDIAIMRATMERRATDDGG